MKENIIKNKALAYAIRIVNAYKFITQKEKEFVLTKQFLRSGTAIGALIWESEHAESNADFIHKLNIALKEANENLFWIILLSEGKYITKKMKDSLEVNCEELIKLLVSIIKTSKKKQAK